MTEHSPNPKGFFEVQKVRHILVKDVPMSERLPLLAEVATVLKQYGKKFLYSVLSDYVTGYCSFMVLDEDVDLIRELLEKYDCEFGKSARIFMIEFEEGSLGEVAKELREHKSVPVAEADFVSSDTHMDFFEEEQLESAVQCLEDAGFSSCRGDYVSFKERHIKEV